MYGLADFFATYLQKNIIFTAVVVTILLGRLFLKKSPKRYSYFLWSAVVLRVVLDLGIHIRFPSPVRNNLDSTVGYVMITGTSLSKATSDLTATAGNIASPVPLRTVILFCLAIIWISGVVLLILKGIIDYLHTKKKVKISFSVGDNIFRCDYIDSPMTIGFIRPHIYLPSCQEYTIPKFVIEHERIHLKRGDIYLKLLAFLILCCYWINPFAWIAFRLFNLDMELSCDEAVLRQYDFTANKEYLKWLVYYSSLDRSIGFAPTAFGASDTKRRVENIMKLKKKGVIATVAGLILALAVVIICLFKLTDKNSSQAKTEVKQEAIEVSIAQDESESDEINTGSPEQSVDPDGSITVKLSDNGQSESADNNLREEEIIISSESEDSEDKTENVTIIDFVWPIENSQGTITQEFSPDHPGIDIAAPKGTNAIAACDGTIEDISYDNTKGNVLKIKANDEVAFLYSHLETFSVKNGDTVKKGDIIGTVGSTGRSTGPHLHLEITTNDQPTDPNTIYISKE